MNAAAAAPPTSRARRDALILAALLFAFFASRIAWVVLEPNTTLYWEEDHRWASAHELLEGARRPLLDYQADHYQGGSLVLVLMVAAVFRVFGESLLGLKLVAMFFAAATLAALYVLGRREFGRWVGPLAAGAYLTGPPLLAFSGLVGMGSHGESALFSLAQIAIFLGLLSGGRHTPAAWAALGVVSGLGIWFCYTSGLSLAACGLTWLILERLPRPKELFAAIGGALLGLLPWFVYNLQHDFVGLTRLAEIFGGGHPIDAWMPHDRWMKLWLLFRRDLALGLVTPFWFTASSPTAPIRIGAVFAPMAVGMALAVFRALRLLATTPWRRERPSPGSRPARDRAELVFVVYAALYLVVYFGSSFVLEPDKGAHTYRLFLPVATLMLVPIARSAASALESGGAARWAAGALCVGFFAASTLSAWATATRETSESSASDADQHLNRGNLVRGVLSHRKYESDLGRAFGEARLVPDSWHRSRFFQGIGWGLAFRLENSGVKPGFFREIDALSLAERTAVISGILGSSTARIADLERSQREGKMTRLELAHLKRVLWLERSARARWDRIPESYRTRVEVSD